MRGSRWADELFVVGVAALILLFVLRAGFLLASPFTVDYGEGTVWTYAHLLQTRGTYFLPINSSPWIHGTYPPLFPRLHSLLGGSLAAGRFVALFGSALAALSIGALLRRQGVGHHRAVLWSCVFLITPAGHTWSSLCRVDSLALGLSLFGLYLLGGKHGCLTAPLSLAAAFFAKQVALAAPIAAFCSLWLSGRKRPAMAFAVIYTGLVLGGFAIIDWSSAGQARHHLITYTGFPGLAPGELTMWLLRFGFTFPVLLPFALLGLREEWRSPIGLYFLTGVGTLLLAVKPGATGNYLLEPTAACVLAAALAVERRLNTCHPLAERRHEYALLLCVQLVAMCEPSRPLELRQLYVSHRLGAAAVAELNRVDPGPVLCEDLGLALAAGREPTFEPFQFGLLARTGMFDIEPVLAELRQGRFKAVIAGWRLRDVKGIANELDNHYTMTGNIGPYELWLPIPSPSHE